MICLSKLRVWNKSFPKVMQSQFSSIKTKYIDYTDGGPENMVVKEREINPEPGSELLMRVKAIGINRAETLQRMGKYPVSKEAEKYLGLEACGEVIDPTTMQKLYDGMVLLSGGSYAQWAAIKKDHVIRKPHNLSYVEGAAIPEGWLTAFQLIGLAELKEGHSVVIYAAASGVGSAAIQICNVLGIHAYAVVSSEEKKKVCLQLGAKGCVLYKDNQSWDSQLLEQSQDRRFDAVLDCVGVSNLQQTIGLLDIDGRWILYGLLSGAKTEVNFARLMQKRIVLKTTLLKARSHEYKADLIKRFTEQVVPSFEKSPNLVKPIVDCVYKSAFGDADSFIKAHEKMQKNENIGKIVISFEE